MRSRALLLTATCLGLGCRADEVPGPSQRSATLRIRVASLTSPTPITIPDVACPLSLRFDSRRETALRGTFERRACTGLAQATPDARGTFTGSMLSDGTAQVVFVPAPLDTFEAVTTSGGCPSSTAAAGPYGGRIEEEAIALSSRFQLNCAGLPFPRPPSFDMEYRIEEPSAR